MSLVSRIQTKQNASRSASKQKSSRVPYPKRQSRTDEPVDDELDSAIHLFLENNGFPRAAKSLVEEVYAAGDYASLLDPKFVEDLRLAWERKSKKDALDPLAGTQGGINMTDDEATEKNIEKRRVSVENLTAQRKRELRKSITEVDAMSGNNWNKKFDTVRGIMNDAKKTNTLQKAAARQIKEFVVYCVFLFFFTTVAVFGMDDASNFRFETRVKTQLAEVELPFDFSHVQKSFDDVATVEELYQWMWGPLHAALYSSGTFDGDPLFAVNRRGFIFGQDMIMGGVRVSQLRVEAEACDVPTELTDHFEMEDEEEAALQWICYPSLDSGASAAGGGGASKATFGSAEGSRLCPPEWSYRDEPKLPCTGPPLGPYQYEQWEEPTYASRNGHRFPAPTHGVVLPNRNGTLALQMVNTLYASHFIDLQTRAVFVDINVYNANIDRISVARFAAEMYPTGGVFTTHKFLTARLYFMHSASDDVNLAFEIIVLVFIVYYIVLEVHDVRQAFSNGYGAAYLKTFSNYAHMINLLIYVCVVAAKWGSVASLPGGVNVGGDDYYDFRTPADNLVISQRLNAVNMFLCWLKVFKYLDFIPEFSQLTDTLALAASGVGTFIIMFSVVGLGAAMAYLLAFGSHLRDYRSLQIAVYSLLRALLGDFDFDELYDVDQLLGPLLFILYIVLAVFVLLNMFIAIISDAYAEVQARLQEGGESRINHEIRTYLFRNFSKMPVIGWLVRCVVRVGSEVAMLVRIRRLSPEEKSECREVFKRFDVDGNGSVSKEECRLIMQYMCPGVQDTDAMDLIDRFFHKADVDRSGDLDFNEFVLVFRYCLTLREMEYFKRDLEEDPDKRDDEDEGDLIAEAMRFRLERRAKMQEQHEKEQSKDDEEKEGKADGKEEEEEDPRLALMKQKLERLEDMLENMTINVARLAQKRG